MSDQITRSIIVKADANRAFSLWENFENFPYFMKNIESVHMADSKISHWKMKGPLGKTIEWTAETTMFEPGKRIGWSTKDHEGDITTSGQVTFNNLSPNETELTVTMQYVPMGGKAGEIVAAIFSNPEKQLEEDLRNFKAYIEGMYNRTAAA